MAAHAQWQIQNSNTTADLRGIDNVGGGVAWASGTNGTVLRTEDGGYVWQTCAIPPGAEKLDFRGIQAFDANTAIVMSSGKGDLSRLYKTADGCQSWKLVFTNPDKDGFWDAVRFEDKNHGMILGDPVNGRFVLLASFDGGLHWTRSDAPTLAAQSPDEGAFAASNSSLHIYGFPALDFVTGGPPGALVYSSDYPDKNQTGDDNCDSHGVASRVQCFKAQIDYEVAKVPLPAPTSTSGGFAIAGDWLHSPQASVVVGGDYTKPNESSGTAAYVDFHFGGGWKPATTPPHGYRSAVAYDISSKSWITVGPNGTDISTDDGKNWRALRPDPARHEAPDADRNWNALSLPFVVGPRGRIGKLNPAALAR